MLASTISSLYRVQSRLPAAKRCRPSHARPLGHTPGAVWISASATPERGQRMRMSLPTETTTSEL